MANSSSIVVHSSKECINPYRDQFGRIEALEAELDKKNREIDEKQAEIEVLKFAFDFVEEINLKNREFNDVEKKLDSCFQTIKEKRKENEKLFKDFLKKLWKMRKKLQEVAGNETIWFFEEEIYKKKIVFKFRNSRFYVTEGENSYKILGFLTFIFGRLGVYKKFMRLGVDPCKFKQEAEKNLKKFIEKK